MNEAHQYVENLLQLYCDDPIGTQRRYQIMKKFADMSAEYDRVDWELSAAIATRFNTEIKACFYNCMRIANMRKELRYCEGYASHTIPVEHAWLVNADGKVIDPTWCLIDEREEARSYFGMILTRRDYSRFNSFEPRWLRAVLREIEKKGGGNEKIPKHGIARSRKGGAPGLRGNRMS